MIFSDFNESAEEEEEPSGDTDASSLSGDLRPRRRSKRNADWDRRRKASKKRASIKWGHLPRRASERSTRGKRTVRYNEESSSSGGASSGQFAILSLFLFVF